MNPRFDDAWSDARRIAEDVTARGFDAIVVRDILGRALVVVRDSDEHPIDVSLQRELANKLRERCRAFAAPEPVLTTKDMYTPELFTASSDLTVVKAGDAQSGRGQLAVLERGIVGREWRHVSSSPGPNHVALYGFKGGVGRSTAATVLAHHFAELGRCVLVVDLDLESPGVSATTIDPRELPDYGLVDYLVESAVNNAAGLDCVARSTRLTVVGNGEVWIAPAGGRARGGYSYLPKLNRAYLDFPDTEGPKNGVESASFAARLRAAVAYCVSEVTRRSRQPDVVLLDSRAGIHDIAAVTITQLSDVSLLFAVDNAQTWNGYRELFQQWRTDPSDTDAIRRRLKMVAAAVPASREEEYLSLFRDRAQLLFGETLYDDADAGDVDAYNPPVDDVEAPHYPLPILFSSDLVGVDVSAGVDWLHQEFVSAAFSRFVQGAAAQILGESGGSGWYDH